MRYLVLASVLALSASDLSAEMYQCTDASGGPLFTNNSKTPGAKGCKLLDIGPMNTVPAPRPPGKAAPAPANFPKVDADTQKQRDASRRRILEQELANEQKLLDQAQKDLAEQESIRLGSEKNYQRVLDRLEPYQKKVKLHENNIANLKKELGNVR
jgi:hypothetical protein